MVKKELLFSHRIPIYFKNTNYVLSRKKEEASAIFFGPFDINAEPYIKIATGDIVEIEEVYGKDEALASVLASIVHELTHYFQWINNIEMTDEEAEKQAEYYIAKVIRQYSKTREHP